MINFNGTIQKFSNTLSIENRGYKYGDALFETLMVVHGKILFWEDHYFRLMASMRILRMEIPMNFTMEFLETEILRTISANDLDDATSRIRLNVHRIDGGRYLPESNLIGYNILAERLNSDFYLHTVNSYTVELFKDYFITPGLLSSIKSNNKIVNVLGSIFAKENNYDNCLLLNSNKNILEALNGNLFLVKDDIIKTPPLEDGCIKGIMRKQVIEIVNSSADFKILESSISPFELQKADELFLTNVIIGIQPISSYRKKEYAATISKILLDKLNMRIRMG